MKLDKLSRRLQATCTGAGDTEITSVVIDSRKAQPGALFAALSGLQCDGHDFIDGALQRGASAVLSGPPTATPTLTVTWVSTRPTRNGF